MDTLPRVINPRKLAGYDFKPDRGCHLHTSCLDCPIALELCPLEANGNNRRHDEAVARQAEAMRLKATGVPVETIAERLGVHPRRVYKLLAASRN